MNLIGAIFVFNTVSMSLTGLIIHYFEPYLPIFLLRTYRYGKYGINTNQSFVEKLEIPKRWFQHFYLFSAPASIFTLCFILLKYTYFVDTPNFIVQILDFLLGIDRKTSIPPKNTLLAMILITIHCCKRLYETTYVSVFSNKKINLCHYIVGFEHYIAVLICVIGESQGFGRGVDNIDINSYKLTILEYVATTVFLWSTYKQLKANIILANLRKNKNGDVVYQGYKIPRHELFDYISAPLQFTEILIYLSLSVILWNSTTYHFITIWVFANQLECAISTHRWNQKTFKNYPPERNVVFPYIY